MYYNNPINCNTFYRIDTYFNNWIKDVFEEGFMIFAVMDGGVGGFDGKCRIAQISRNKAHPPTKYWV